MIFNQEKRRMYGVSKSITRVSPERTFSTLSVHAHMNLNHAWVQLRITCQARTYAQNAHVLTHETHRPIPCWRTCGPC